jgi:general secretion pathway protein D
MNPGGRPRARGLGAVAVAALLACRPEAAPDRTAPAPPPLDAPSPSPATAAPVSSAEVGAPSPSVPGASGSARPGRFLFDFEDADLPALVRLVGGITGKRFILTGQLPVVHATVHAPEPVTADEAYQAFLAILQANGLTVVPSGDFWKILPSPGR